MIIILWATIRPKMFCSRHKSWISNSSDPQNIKTYAAVNTKAQQETINNYDKNIEVYICGDQKGIVKPIYTMTSNLKAEDSDIIISVSDDFNCFSDWDLYLAECFNDFDGALFINDGLQPTDTNGNTIITLPIMTFSCLKKLNKILYHPDYMHYFGDNELFINLFELNLLKDIRKTSKIFQHDHYTNGKRPRDHADNIVINYCGNHDREVYAKRRVMNIEKRLQI